MTFVEPVDVYASRISSRLANGNANTVSVSASHNLNAALRFADGWDEHILAYASAQAAPVRIVSLASQLRKCVRHRDKQHKEKLKRDILLRIGALIRVGSLIRVRRKYVLPGTR